MPGLALSMLVPVADIGGEFFNVLFDAFTVTVLFNTSVTSACVTVNSIVNLYLSLVELLAV